VQVRPSNGKVKPLVGGLAGATNVAVVGGRIYVSEIGGFRITKITQDLETKLHAEVHSPAGLEFANKQLYAGVGVFSEGGSLVTVTP
jgi:hypothetical protein